MTKLTLDQAEKNYLDALYNYNSLKGDLEAAKRALELAGETLRRVTQETLQAANPEPMEALHGFDTDLE